MSKYFGYLIAVLLVIATGASAMAVDLTFHFNDPTYQVEVFNCKTAAVNSGDGLPHCTSIDDQNSFSGHYVDASNSLKTVNGAPNARETSNGAVRVAFDNTGSPGSLPGYALFVFKSGYMAQAYYLSSAQIKAIDAHHYNDLYVPASGAAKAWPNVLSPIMKFGGDKPCRADVGTLTIQNTNPNIADEPIRVTVPLSSSAAVDSPFYVTSVVDQIPAHRVAEFYSTDLEMQLSVVLKQTNSEIYHDKLLLSYDANAYGGSTHPVLNPLRFDENGRLIAFPEFQLGPSFAGKEIQVRVTSHVVDLVCGYVLDDSADGTFTTRENVPLNREEYVQISTFSIIKDQPLHIQGSPFSLRMLVSAKRGVTDAITGVTTKTNIPANVSLKIVRPDGSMIEYPYALDATQANGNALLGPFDTPMEGTYQIYVIGVPAQPTAGMTQITSWQHDNLVVSGTPADPIPTQPVNPNPTVPPVPTPVPVPTPTPNPNPIPAPNPGPTPTPTPNPNPNSTSNPTPDPITISPSKTFDPMYPAVKVIGPQARAQFSRIDVAGNAFSVKAGSTFQVYTYMSNTGDTNLEHARVIVTIPGLGIRRVAGPFTSDSQVSGGQRLAITLPKYAKPGVYPMKVAIYSDNYQDAIWRNVRIG